MSHTQFLYRHIFLLVYIYTLRFEISGTASCGTTDSLIVLDLASPPDSDRLLLANLQGAPPSAQETECADTTWLLQKPKPPVFAHQEWQPPSLASRHTEQTASASNSTIGGSNLRLAILMTTALSSNHRRFSVQHFFGQQMSKVYFAGRPSNVSRAVLNNCMANLHGFPLSGMQ